VEGMWRGAGGGGAYGCDPANGASFSQEDSAGGRRSPRPFGFPGKGSNSRSDCQEPTGGSNLRFDPRFVVSERCFT